METGLKAVGMGWGWKENTRGGVWKKLVDAGRVQFKVFTPWGGDWVKS